MAEAAVSSVIDQLVDLLFNEAKLLSGVHKKVSSIKSELESIQCFLKDADARAETGEISDGVKVWVKQVRELAYWTEDVIDKYILAERPRRHGFIHKITFSIFKLKPRRKIASQIKDIGTTMVEIKSRAERYRFSSSSGTKYNTLEWHDPRVAFLFTEEDEVIGIESPRDELISRLAAGESKRVVISLVGMGGLGKTTLAKKAYDNQIVTGHFDCCAWIPVSQSYKAEDLLREMIKQFHKARKDFAPPEGIDTMGETSLISELREYLQPKRYVVVFDDVWTIDFWGFIKNALPKNHKGSRVIITTRNDDIGSSCKESSLDIVQKVWPLPEDKAWELFCRKAFQSNTGECPPELENFSFEIVRRCEGLPLAIVAIGGLLSTKNNDVFEWQKFCHSLGSELERNPHLTSMTKIIFLSYHDLPYYLKSCFLYLGILPEDYSIEGFRLIRLWIAEGFVKEQKGKTLEEVGAEYLTELIHRSLVKVSDIEAGTYRVHDLVREIILSKSEELSFCQVLSEENLTFDPQTRRLSIHNSMDNVLEITGNSRIRSVFLFRVSQLPEPSLGRLVSNFKLMKVLDLEDAPLDYLPEEVGNLFHLRYLSVRNAKIKMIPRSIGKLHNLQTLDMRQCPVSELPVEISRLHKLRHLMAYYSNDDTNYNLDHYRGLKIRKGIGHLQELQTLLDVDAYHDGVSLMKELKNLRQLRRLGIKRLTRESGRGLCTSIEKMKQLRCLAVWAISGEEILDLQSISSPPQYLQELYLRGRLEKLFDWIPKLENVVYLSLQMSGLSDDPLKALQDLPNLLTLDLYQGYVGEQLHFEAEGFQKLKKLFLGGLKGLNSLIIDKGALPLLEELSIGPSPQLKEVPSGIYYLTKLTSLEFWDMSKDFLDRMTQDEGQDYWILHIPVVRFWLKDTETGYKSFILW